jgi:hypothetical protein
MVVAMAMMIGAANAMAADIEGKWGIGAGVFGGGGEITLIRGKSPQSAWLFDVTLTDRDDNRTIEFTPPAGPSLSQNTNTLTMRVGPGYRRFISTGDFTPYWDVRARLVYTRLHAGAGSDDASPGLSDTETRIGPEAVFSFGLEYFTPWRFSVAVHSGVASVSWVSIDATRRNFALPEQRTSGSSTIASIGLSPVLFVRGYF